MSGSFGYSGYRRACDALRSQGIAIDVPAAGYLCEGTHHVVIEKVVEFDEYDEVTFAGENGDTHKQRVYARDAIMGTIRPSMGTHCTITLGWPVGCYRTERTDQGYMAIIDGEEVGGPYSTLTELDRHAKESRVKRAYLRIVEYTQG